MEKELAEIIEVTHNVIVDAEKEIFNINDTEYGWRPIPPSWIDALRNDEYRQLKQTSGKSHAELAELVGLSESAAKKWARDENIISSSHLELLKLKLGK